MTAITDLADQAVILPLVLVVALAWLAQGRRRAAAVWLLAVCATFAVMLALKLFFLGCPGVSSLRTPSGHVAAAAIMAGGLAMLLSSRRWPVLPAALLAALVIGWTRLALGEHTLHEVLVGALVGLAGVLALLRFAGPLPPQRFAPRIALAALAVVLVFHGLHFPAEARIRATAHMLAVCQLIEARL